MLGKLLGKKQISESLGIVDKMVTDKDQKNEIVKDLIDSENKSGSTFTRNARPSIIYFGLFLMFTEIFGIRYLCLSSMELPIDVFKQSNAMLEYFIFTWGGITTVYIGGRTYEKKKMRFFKKSKEE